MLRFRIFVFAMWAILLAVSWRAVAEMGMAGGTVFFSDFAQPWRAQFNTDLVLHLVLFAVWVFWRERSKLVGIVCAVLCMFGGIFTFLYLLASLLRAGGNIRILLLGSHA